MRQHKIQPIACRLPGIEAVAADSSFSFGRHSHDCFGIGLMDRGAQKSHSGRGQVESAAGNIITVNPGEVHDGAPLGESRAWRMLYFQPPLMAEYFGHLSDTANSLTEFIRPVFHDPRLAGHFNRLFYTLTACEDRHFRLAVDEALLSLSGAVTQIPRREPGLANDVIHLARERMDDDPASPITLAEMASAAGLSPFQLLRGFSRRMGITPHGYLMQRRLGLARQRIVQGCSLAEAAADAGFADQSHMTRLFVRSFGYTPGLFARSLN